jgi:DNA-binding NarL/FixJ family response regulator
MNELPDQNASARPPVKVVVIEDEAWMRENLAQEINRGAGMRCINTYRTAEDALAGIPGDHPDVVLMDINLPGMDGVECMRRLRVILPDVRCLMLTVYEESDKIFNSLLAGASGYLLKRTGTAELMEAIQQVADGGSPMSSSIARKVVAYFNELGEKKSDTSALSPREQQVLELLAKGAAYKAIADQLALSIETIRMNVKHIYAKLHVHSRGEATAKFLQQSRFPSGPGNRGRQEDE